MRWHPVLLRVQLPSSTPSPVLFADPPLQEEPVGPKAEARRWWKSAPRGYPAARWEQLVLLQETRQARVPRCVAADSGGTRFLAVWAGCLLSHGMVRLSFLPGEGQLPAGCRRSQRGVLQPRPDPTPPPWPQRKSFRAGRTGK